MAKGNIILLHSLFVETMPTHTAYDSDDMARCMSHLKHQVRMFMSQSKQSKTLLL